MRCWSVVSEKQTANGGGGGCRRKCFFAPLLAKETTQPDVIRQFCVSIITVFVLKAVQSPHKVPG